MKKNSRVYAAIHLDALEQNLENMKKNLTPGTRMIGVIKANAYGHGAIEVAKVLEEDNVDYICVAGLNEAIELRNNNIKLPILVMGYTPDDCLDIAIQHNITVTIFSKEQAEILSNKFKKTTKKANIHIKIDTGFNRIMY